MAKNPIRQVDGKPVPCPSSYQWSQTDVSAANAGRTEDVTMDKMRIGMVAKLDLAWQNVSTQTASEVLQLFDPEYITVEFLDPKIGGYRTSEFYVGDRSAPLYSTTNGVWSNVSFNIIERRGR